MVLLLRVEAAGEDRVVTFYAKRDAVEPDVRRRAGCAVFYRDQRDGDRTGAGPILFGHFDVGRRRGFGPAVAVGESLRAARVRRATRTIFAAALAKLPVQLGDVARSNRGAGAVPPAVE